MFTKSTRTLHQYTGAGTSNQELDRSTLIPHLPDSFPAPSGTIWEGVDRSTLQLVANLFPAETCGRVFFARFFERAAVEKSVIPDAARDTVYICTQSIASLGKELGLSNDTTHKYVKLSMALGLLRKQKFMGRLAFLLFVGIYHPPQTLESDLDFLIQHSRPKLRTMAIDVKARCKLYGLISQDLITALEHLNALLQRKSGAKHTLEQQIAQVQALASTILRDATIRYLPLGSHRKDDRQDQHAPTSSGEDGPEQRTRELFAQNLPLLESPADDEVCGQESTSTHNGPTERRRTPRATSNLPGIGRRVDPEREDQKSESTQAASTGRFDGSSIPPNLPSLQTQRDSTSRERSIESARSASTGRFDRPASAKNLPVSGEQGDSGSPANVNVITIIGNITLNVKIVAAFCCNALNEPLSKQPIYLKLFRECEHDAQAISAALLFTLVHRRDGTMRNPASVFVTRCRDYHTQGVPDEAAGLVRQYGSLTYAQLLDALRTSPVFIPPARGAPPPAGISPLPTPLSSLSPLPRWGTLPRLIATKADRSGMSREEALQVIKCARGDRRTKMCRADLEPLSDGSYAVLLDNTITAVPRQTYFYSLQDWKARTATIEDCFELFGVPRSGRRCLADALKARRELP